MKKLTTSILALSLAIAGCTQAPTNIVATPVATIVAKLDKFEMIVTLTAGYTNPYDYDDIAIRAVFFAPSGRKDTVDAFFMQDYTLNATNGNLTSTGSGNFKVRYSPNQIGIWNYLIIATNTAGTAISATQSFSVTSSTAKGFIRKNESNYLNFDDNEQYIPIGQNQAWQVGNIYTDYKSWLQKLSDNKANFIRVWEAVWGLAIEWKNGTDGFTGLKKYKQTSAYYTDWLLDECKNKGIFMMLCINHHGMVSSGVNPNWPDNPYNAANGGPCTNTWDFFINTTAKALHKNRLRYIVARWGYSQNIMSWELFNEVDWTDQFNTYKDNVKDWHLEMAAYLKNIDVYKHLVTTSYANGAYDPNTWNSTLIDFTQTHNYIGSPNVENALAGISGDYVTQFNKPTLNGEYGIDAGASNLSTIDPNGIYIHNSIWATTYSGAMGAGASWWWDTYIDPRNLYTHYKPLADFTATVPLKDGKYKKTTSFSTGGGTSDLTLTPGVGFALAPTGSFTIDASGTTTPSAAQLSNYLFGSTFNTQNRRPPTFSVTYPVTGQFKVVTGGSTGTTPKMDIYLDNTLVLDQNAAINTTYSINVPVGAHTIKVDNLGTDWIYVTSYVFTNIGAALNTYTVRNSIDSTKVSGWIHNKRYNWQYVGTSGTPPAVTGASLTINNMRNGTYTVQFYSCSTGAATTTATGTATNNNLVIPLPDVAWDVAVTATWAGFTTPVIDLPDAKQLKIYPNPRLQGSIYVSYELIRPQQVNIEVYDISGNKVANVFSGMQTTGAKLVEWKTEVGKLAPGVYFMKINMGKDSGTQKIIVYQ